MGGWGQSRCQRWRWLGPWGEGELVQPIYPGDPLRYLFLTGISLSLVGEWRILKSIRIAIKWRTSRKIRLQTAALFLDNKIRTYRNYSTLFYMGSPKGFNKIMSLFSLLRHNKHRAKRGPSLSTKDGDFGSTVLFNRVHRPKHTLYRRSTPSSKLVLKRVPDVSCLAPSLSLCFHFLSFFSIFQIFQGLIPDILWAPLAITSKGCVETSASSSNADEVSIMLGCYVLSFISHFNSLR